MIYFCADDYGISPECNARIEQCVEYGVLNKISVLPNGKFDDLQKHVSNGNVQLSLHLNLVEGYSLSPKNDVSLIVSDTGCFKYSFIGLFWLSLFGNKKELEKQLYRELQRQLVFWKTQMGENTPLSIDSHQHTHMIPLVFKTLLRVIRDEQVIVESIRIPAEPIAPYILTPSLYKSYTLQGLVKQWLLKFLAWINHRKLRQSHLQYAYFMGALFSGKLTEEKISKLLPRYTKMAEKHGKHIEIALHPGYLENDEQLIEGYRTGFQKFYFSQWRQKEHNTLIHLKRSLHSTKEGTVNALH